MTESFPSDVAAKLKFYVYRLIDPRNGETFYVGKGKGNRVFSHIRAAEGLEGDDIGNKLSADPGDPARRLRGQPRDPSSSTPGWGPRNSALRRKRRRTPER